MAAHPRVVVVKPAKYRLLCVAQRAQSRISSNQLSDRTGAHLLIHPNPSAAPLSLSSLSDRLYNTENAKMSVSTSSFYDLFSGGEAQPSLPPGWIVSPDGPLGGLQAVYELDALVTVMVALSCWHAHRHGQWALALAGLGLGVVTEHASLRLGGTHCHASGALDLSECSSANSVFYYLPWVYACVSLARRLVDERSAAFPLLCGMLFFGMCGVYESQGPLMGWWRWPDVQMVVKAGCGITQVIAIVIVIAIGAGLRWTGRECGWWPRRTPNSAFHDLRSPSTRLPWPSIAVRGTGNRQPRPGRDQARLRRPRRPQVSRAASDSFRLLRTPFGSC